MNIEQPLDGQFAELKEKMQASYPSEDKLQNWFTYHPPTPEDVDRYKKVRDAALDFARVISAECPPGADATTAIRKVREAVMTANAAIACCGK